MTEPALPAASRHGTSMVWIIVATVCIGSFMGQLDASITQLVLPALEREFAALCATSHAVACASGTDALWLALVAAGVVPGDSVITTPFSFFATASSIIRAGARPVFVATTRDPRERFIRYTLQAASSLAFAPVK